MSDVSEQQIAEQRSAADPGAVSEPSPWKPLADRRREREARREIKREAVLRTATRLFVDQGYHHTTLDEVAGKLHITKPALFHYFASKEDILLECYRLGTEMMDNMVLDIISDPGSGKEKLSAFIVAYAEFMTTEFGRLVVHVSDQELTGEARARVRSDKRAIDLRLRDIINEGIADGSIALCDSKLAGFAIAGAMNWIGVWYQTTGSLDPHTVATTFAHLLTRGVAAPN